MSISWIAVSMIAPPACSFHRREVAADRVVRRDVGDVVGGDLEVVQVRLQAVAAAHPGDRLVVGVHDDVFALAEAEREHAPLPPRQVALTFVCLLVQVLRRFAPRELVEPDEPALRRVDQRPVLTRTGPVGREDVARRGIVIGHGDGQDRGLDAGQRVEALVVGGRRRRVGERRDGCRRIWGVDAKAEGDRPAAVCAGADHGPHDHALAGVERLVGHEAAAVALGVPVHVAVVVAGFGADDRDFLDVRDIRAEEADLGVRVGRVGSRLGRDVDVGAGQARAVFERRRQARGRGPARARRSRSRRTGRGRESRSRSRPRPMRGPRPAGRCIRCVSCRASKPRRLPWHPGAIRREMRSRRASLPTSSWRLRRTHCVRSER